MPTGTAGSTARDFHTNQTHYLKKNIAYNDAATANVIGTLPANCFVTRAYAAVTTAYAGASANALAVGVGSGGSGLVAALSLNTVGVVLSTTLATAAATAFNPTVDTVITATFASTGVTTTAGTATVIVEYINL